MICFVVRSHHLLVFFLVGMDHKLHIILNKADQFKRIHDFARAYGSLCWNLSKVNTRFSAPVMIIVVTTVVVLIVAIAIANQVIPRKDLPRIYTMCLPPSYQAASSGDQSADEQHTLGQGLADLERTREEVVKEVSAVK
jgi:hypothetical protein